MPIKPCTQQSWIRQRKSSLIPTGESGLPCQVLYGEPTPKQHYLNAIPFKSLLDESTASKLRKIYIRELALISPIRQLLAPFSAEGGIRLPRYRVMRQQPSFAQAHWFLSIVSIKSDAVRLALVEKCCDCYLSGRSEKVCELRIGFCPVISRIHRADRMEELASCFTKIR